VSAWRFWSADQQLPRTVHDVSADEAGNVYVAASEALLVKRRGDDAFTRVDPGPAGLTASCHDPSFIREPSPPDPPAVCPIISVAGMGPGAALVGYKGVGTDDDRDARWAIVSGGADVVSFDGTAVRRTRHVFDASPPGVVCEDWLDPPTNSRCNPFDDTWRHGRMKMRQINRIAINRRQGIGFHDALLGGSHGTFSILVANPDARGWAAFDKTAAAAATDPIWTDARFVWEHEHADASSASDGIFRSGETWALAFDPTTGVPWGANEFQIASLPGYSTRTRPSANNWWGDVSATTIWHPEKDTANPSLRDGVQSIAFCDDGTMWVGSLGNGLARRAPDGTWSSRDLPSGFGNVVSAVACDPSDRSVWVGLGWGGLLRLRNGAFEDPFAGLAGTPAFARFAPVKNVQIDRWATPRIVYVAYQAWTDGSGNANPGGVAAFSGP
jgi:hypothetical protein